MFPEGDSWRSTGAQGGAILAGTVFFTFVFVGFLALVSGNAVGIQNRLSLYVLCAAGLFVLTTVTLARRRLDGTTVLFAAVGATLLTFLLVALAGEGIRYAVVRPGAVLRPGLLAYFAAAGLVVIGVTYWTLKYWRDFLPRDRPEDPDAS